MQAKCTWAVLYACAKRGVAVHPGLGWHLAWKSTQTRALEVSASIPQVPILPQRLPLGSGEPCAHKDKDPTSGLWLCEVIVAQGGLGP